MGKRILFLAFAVIGVAVLLWGYDAYKKSQEAKDWPTTEGKVISSEVGSHRSRSGGHSTTIYSAKVIFEYSVNGKAYTSKKVSFGEYGSSSRRDAQKVFDKYPATKAVIVYYNPAKPEIAILEPGKIGGLWIPFIVGAGFVIVGILGAISKTIS